MRRKFKRRWSGRPPPLTESQILAWADACHERTGKWPKHFSGRIADSLGEKWGNVDGCLRNGQRGLPGGSSLAQLLAQRRGVRNIHGLPPLSKKQILAWADAFHARTGQWPKKTNGRIAGSLGELWLNVDQCLRAGLRGLPGGSSLARLLAQKRGVRNNLGLPPLTTARILRWADAHRRRTGRWPTRDSGPIQDAPTETWSAVAVALHQGLRSLPGGSSLARLLQSARGVRNIHGLSPLSVRQILAWADAHRRRTGNWPIRDSGPIQDAPGDTWAVVDDALRRGARTLPDGFSLARLLQSQRGVRNKSDLPPLQRRQIRAWADAYRERTGTWPTKKSGPIREAPGETWAAVAAAWHRGSRGLRPGGSIYRLLMKQRDCV